MRHCFFHFCLFGCLRGGSSSVSSTASFNLKAAWANLYLTPSSAAYTVSGNSSDSGYGIVTGIVTFTPSSDTVFEGKSAKKGTASSVGKFVRNGVTSSFNSISNYYFDGDLNPLGDDDGSSYSVVVGVATLPTAARVGDKGTAYIINEYSDSTKTGEYSTSTHTYLIEADTANTALVTLTSTRIESDGVTYTSALQARISAGNVLTLLKNTSSNSIVVFN